MHQIYSVLVTLLGWPAGILLGNLIANVFWVPVQYAGLHLKLSAHHGAIHERLDAIERLLDECPNCGHPRSATDLLPSMTASSIDVSSKDTEA